MGLGYGIDVSLSGSQWEGLGRPRDTVREAGLVADAEKGQDLTPHLDMPHWVL